MVLLVLHLRLERVTSMQSSEACALCISETCGQVTSMQSKKGGVTLRVALQHAVLQVGRGASTAYAAYAARAGENVSNYWTWASRSYETG